MTQIEQIRQEIERLNEQTRENEKSGLFSESWILSRKTLLDKLTKFLNTLEQSQLPADVEEAAKQYHERIQFSSRPSFYDAFIAGAEWAFSQGEIVEGSLGYGPHLQRPIIMLEGVPSFYDGHCQDVTVQIRKKD